MPLSLDLASEDDKKAQTQAVEVDSLETHNPHALSPRAQTFCDLAIALTQNNTRTLTEDEFKSLSQEYDKLEGVERFGAASALGRIGITWLQTLENSKDGYDDELNGYDVYVKVCAAKTAEQDGGYG
jgi:hypothetical protein